MYRGKAASVMDSDMVKKYLILIHNTVPGVICKMFIIFFLKYNMDILSSFLSFWN